MEKAILFAIFISGLLVSFTGYALIYLFWAIFSTTKRSIRGTLNNFIL
nr:photosystem II protein N [Phacellanthus tubiflorus]UYR95056.1 photosystem II protein N [Phacellanthus tubiflorus]